MRIGDGFRDGRISLDHGQPPPKAEARAEASGRTNQEEGPSPFARILHGLGREVDRGEAIVHRAIRGGGDLGPTELIALQAGVYRYSEAVDLSAKLIDRATSGVKTVIQGQ
jgi:hypothetical protein